MRTVVSKCIHNNHFNAWLTHEYPLQDLLPQKESFRPKGKQDLAQVGLHS
jgi:hypothetical protein